METISDGLLLLGGFVAFSGALGVLRMPDFYSRLHPAGTADTMAQLLVLSGLVLRNLETTEESLVVVGKLIAISVLLMVTTPTATHAISRAAHLSGLAPWTGRSATGSSATGSSADLETDEETP